MRQVVVLEPAGSVLVIRQHSLAGCGGPGTAGCNALEAGANTTAAPGADHNQNRIVVVRSPAVPVRNNCPTTAAARLASVTLRRAVELCIAHSLVSAGDVDVRRQAGSVRMHIGLDARVRRTGGVCVGW